MLSMLGMVPSALKIGAVVAVIAAVGGAYWHYTNVKNQRDLAIAQVSALNLQVETQNQTIDSLEIAVEDWSRSAERFQATLDALANAQVEATAEARRLNDVLGKHDLERLADAKPVLIERRINSGTADILRLLRCASGSGSEDCPDRD